MASSPTELSLDCKANIIGSVVLKSHATEKTQKLEEFVARLEEEKLKIEGFKSELPLCMQLLANAVEASRQELQSHNQLISADKANWMSSARLWNHQVVEGSSQSESESQRVNGKGGIVSQELGLASSSYYQREIQDCSQVSGRENSVGSGNGTKEKRKARRCWSPHLHRRFLNALHLLGGSQLATPKQITQLMKVDGLTSDEVKSHLQKYRLHTGILQAPSPSPVLVVGSIWISPEYAAHGGAPAAAFYGAHAATTHRVPPP